MSRYKVVLFDMDGVLVDSMHHHADSWIRVFSELGIHMTKDDIFKREGMSGIASIKDILTYYGHPVPDNRLTEELLRRKLEIFEKKKISMFPEIPVIIQYLQSHCIAQGIVTGSLRRSVQFVLPEEILKQFSIIITVDDIKKGKPDPEPYQKAINFFGCVPKQALVIENAPLGIISAKNAGADCAAIETTLDRSFLYGADIVFKDHGELLVYLQGIFG